MPRSADAPLSLPAKAKRAAGPSPKAAKASPGQKFRNLLQFHENHTIRGTRKPAGIFPLPQTG
jgi:hypothetical protein